MVAFGTPDFQRTSQRSGAPLLALTNQQVVGTYTSPALVIAPWSAMVARFAPTTALGGFRVRFKFYGDSALTQFVSTIEYHLYNGAVLADQIPCLAPFCVVEIVNGAAAPNDRLDVTLSPVDIVSIGAFQSVAVGLLVVPTTGIGAGGGAQAYATQVTAGAAQVNFAAYIVGGSPVNMNFDFRYVDYLGFNSGYLLQQLQGTDLTRTQVMFLPAYTLAVFVRNDGAGTSGATVLITPQT